MLRSLAEILADAVNALAALRRAVKRWLRRWLPGRLARCRPLFDGWRMTGVIGLLPIPTPTGFSLATFRFFVAPSTCTASIQTVRLDHYTRLYTVARN